MNNSYGRPPRSASKGTKNSSSPVPPVVIDRSRSHQSSSSYSYDFQMMDVLIGIDIMEGLVMECARNKGESPLGSTQINAIVSCNKNVSRSRQIATHVPSLPLTVPVASFGDKVHNFLVRWPADFDPHGDALSTFKLSKLMKRDAFYADAPGLNTGFVPDEIELSIGLMRGSEILTLGKTKLIVTGNEVDEMIIDLPISNEKEVVKNKTRDPSPLKRTSSKVFGKSTKNTTKTLKPLSFPSDKSRKFHLTDNAMIRLRVQLFPRQESGSSFDMPVATGKARPYVSQQHASPSHDYSSYSKEDSTDNSSYDSYTGYMKNYEDIQPVQPHKYHPYIPMDELQQDFGRMMHLRNDSLPSREFVPQEVSNRSHSRSSRQERSIAKNSSTDYYGMNLQHRKEKPFNRYEPVEEYSSHVDRSRTPGKSRGDPYPLRNDGRYSPYGHNQIKYNRAMKSNGHNYDYSDEDTENINVRQYRKKDLVMSSKPKGKQISTTQHEQNESPMTWLYDKLVGGGNTNPSSTAESLVTKKRSNYKQSSSTHRYHHNLSSPKRTMRV